MSRKWKVSGIALATTDKTSLDKPPFLFIRILSHFSPPVSYLPVLTGTQNPVLRKVAEPVEKITDEILQLKKEMQKTMKEEKGVGLAAPQVGVLQRIILVTLGKKEIFMINPIITSFSAETNIDDEEGCLSVPDEFGNVPRSTFITLEYLDENGKKQKKNLDHFDARVVQHEIDHLNGVLFVDRVVEKKSLLEKASIF